MLFLTVLNAHIGFSMLFKYWNTAPPGECNVWCWQVHWIIDKSHYAVIHFRNTFCLLSISNIKIFWSVILPRLTYINDMLWYNSSFQGATYVDLQNDLIVTIWQNLSFGESRINRDSLFSYELVHCGYVIRRGLLIPEVVHNLVYCHILSIKYLVFCQLQTCQ